ncbi:hypothetical protein EWM64_g7435 [Hericium alpestre]|uniref:Uncharacterized protein n=1 Tax=Hericium alpestre TaxID=135208 RepID=A0A4Y9ZQS9_9AGAM|nr:hypothetical protein EWM64_g7435 [Hericium alpestre]
MPLVQIFNPYCRLVWLMLELIVLATVGAFAVFKKALYAEGWFSAAKAVFFYLNSLLPSLLRRPIISAPKVIVAIPDIIVTKDDDKQPDPPSPPPPYSSVVPVQPVQPADKTDKAITKPPSPLSRPLPIPPSAPPPWEGYSMIPVKHYKDGKWSVYEAKYWNGARYCVRHRCLP